MVRYQSKFITNMFNVTSAMRELLKQQKMAMETGKFIQ